MKKLLNADNPIEVIGTRHGEKLHETLLSREEMVRATDQGKYFRVPLDVRSMVYESYYEDGNSAVADLSDYTSENTDRLGLADTKKLLLTLPELQDVLGIDPPDVPEIELEPMPVSVKVDA